MAKWIRVDGATERLRIKCGPTLTRTHLNYLLNMRNGLLTAGWRQFRLGGHQGYLLAAAIGPGMGLPENLEANRLAYPALSQVDKRDAIYGQALLLNPQEAAEVNLR